jgi:transposase-like protein
MAKYHDLDRARVYHTLVVNNGNVKKTARETGVPISTVRVWKRDWDEDGVPPELLDMVIEIKEFFIEEAERARDEALRRLRIIIPKETNARTLATVIGILDDKVTRAKGLPTARTEQTLNLPNPEEARELFSRWAQESIDAAMERQADIIEVEAERVDQAAIPQSIPEGD